MDEVRTYARIDIIPNTNHKTQQGRVQVDVGLGEEILAKYGELQEAVLPRWRGALDDVHSKFGRDVALGGKSRN